MNEIRERKMDTVKMFLLLFAVLLFVGCVTTKKITITSNPSGATVYLNGMESGITTLTKELLFPENKQIEVAAKKEGYKVGKITIGLEPYDKTNYHINLEKITKKVTITSDPSEATVYLNGVESGITTLIKELLFAESKKIEAVVMKEGYEEGKTTIALEPLEKTDYHVRLEKKEVVSVELVSFEPHPTDKGVELAIVRKPTLAYLETIERSPNVMSVTRVINNEDIALQIGSPVLSPVEDILVYQVFIEEKDGASYSSIWKQSIGLSAKTRITYGKWLDLFPSFTPDGQNLVFSSNRASSNPTLWQIKVEGGGGITKITYSLAEDHSSSVSSDGSVIAYTSIPARAKESQIWTVRKDGSLPTQLREGESPQISPDGGKILFVRKDNDSGKNQMWLMNIDGSVETQLTQNIDYDVIDPRWSPDGKWIVFSSDEGFDSKKNRNYDIWLMASDGYRRMQLTTNGSRDDGPCWDYSGKFIYFRSNRGGTWNIWRFNPMMPHDALGEVPQESKVIKEEQP